MFPPPIEQPPENFPPIPFSWYTVAFEKDLKPGTVRTARFAETEVVVFRTESGEIRATEPYCPHLGAHLGRGGCVSGETIECPFHRFRFDTNGDCTFTPFGPPPRNTSIRMLPVQVVHGLVMVYYGPDGEQPDWNIDMPTLEPGWTKMRTAMMPILTHPQDINENGLDYQHFRTLHDFDDFEVTADVELSGPRIFNSYRGIRKFPGGIGLPFSFETTLYGMGYSHVIITVGKRWQIRQLTCSTPISRTTSEAYVGVSVKKQPGGILKRMFFGPVEWAFGRFVLLVIADEVKKDKLIWDYKTFVAKPRIAKGDGPIGRYRIWARQFYANPDADNRYGDDVLPVAQ